MPPFKPYVSRKQEQMFNSPGAAAKGIKPMDVAGKNAASKGLNLPDRVPSKSKRNFKIKIRKKHFAKKPMSAPLPQMGNPMGGPMAPPMGMA